MTQLVLGGNLSMIHRVLFEKRVFQKFQNYRTKNVRLGGKSCDL